MTGFVKLGFLGLALMVATSAQAATIIPPAEGCINLSDLSGDFTYRVIIDGPGQRIKAGAWWTGKPGCEPTTHHQRPLDIEGGTSVLRNPMEGTEILIGWNYRKQSQCGRHQVDVLDVLNNRMYGVVINSGIVCPKSPKPPKPPKPRPEDPDPPYVPEPEPPPVVEIPPVVVPPVEEPPVPIPEPTSLVLVGSALALAARNRLKKKR